MTTAISLWLYRETFVRHNPFLLTLKKLEYQLRDWQARYGRKAERDPNLIFLAVDEQSISLSALGPQELAASPTLALMKRGFPYHREVYAHILERLVNAGARLVIFDFLFVNAREGDDVFRQKLEQYRDKVIVGWNRTTIKENAEREVLQMPSESLFPNLDWADDRLGGVNVDLDEDETFRRATFYYKYSSLSPTLTSMAAQAVKKCGYRDLVPDGFERHTLRWTGRPYSREEPGQGFRPWAVYEIFDPKIWHATYKDGAFFKDKIVLVGPEGNFHHDQQYTPFGVTAGPEIHLNIINALLKRDFLRETSHATNMWLIIGAGIVGWLAMSAIRSPMTGGVVFTGLNVLYIAVAQIFYDHQGLYVLLFMPLLGLDACGFFGLFNEYLAERREKSRVRSTLERYVSKNVVREVLDNPDTYFNKLGGVRLPVTILFSDVRDFTSITESGDATQLVTQLNEYLEEMTKAVFANNGTLDKFIGDAVMAVWGNVQTAGPDRDARSAVETALLMRQSLAALNVRWEPNGWRPWKFGIGINQGEAIVGNIGSHEKMDPTVIGDPVNLASRLEGLTKKYHTDIIISDNVAAHLQGAYHLQKLDVVRAKGKSRPVDLYAVWGRSAEPLSEGMEEYLLRFGEALALYHERKFAEARRAFTLAAKAKTGDYLTQMYQERCEFFRQNPPGDEWDGVYVFTEK